MASINIGLRVCVHAVEATFRSRGVTAPARLAQIVEMLDAYVVLMLLTRLLTVVMSVSLYTTTLCMLKATGCKRTSEIVCMSPLTDKQKTDVFEKTNPRQHLPARVSVPPMSSCDIVICIENNESTGHAVSSVPASTASAVCVVVYSRLTRLCMLLSQP